MNNLLILPPGAKVHKLLELGQSIQSVISVEAAADLGVGAVMVAEPYAIVDDYFQYTSTGSDLGCFEPAATMPPHMARIRALPAHVGKPMMIDGQLGCTISLVSLPHSSEQSQRIEDMRQRIIDHLASGGEDMPEITAAFLRYMAEPMATILPIMRCTDCRAGFWLRAPLRHFNGAGTDCMPF